MFTRLLLALLLAAFAVPATAVMPACHGGSAQRPHAAASDHHRPDPLPAAHVCIGCAPIADWLGERIAPPVPPAGIGPAVRIARLDRVRAAPPALPPPRRG